jgi:hypothetical protein
MNLSRNKLNKIANTKYQSRKNRPLKKKKAGASKIHTKFTKKRKNGGKGKNLRKNSLKKKITFHKKGGELTEQNIEELKKKIEDATNNYDKYSNSAGGTDAQKEELKIQMEEAINKLDAAEEKKLAEEAKKLAEEEAQKLEEEEAQKLAEAQQSVPAETIPQKETSDSSISNNFTVTLDYIHTDSGPTLKNISTNIDGGDPQDGVATILGLFSGKHHNSDTWRQSALLEAVQKLQDAMINNNTSNSGDTTKMNTKMEDLTKLLNETVNKTDQVEDKTIQINELLTKLTENVTNLKPEANPVAVVPADPAAAVDPAAEQAAAPAAAPAAEHAAEQAPAPAAPAVVPADQAAAEEAAAPGPVVAEEGEGEAAGEAGEAAEAAEEGEGDEDSEEE